jgi:phosphoserine phosphatase
LSAVTHPVAVDPDPLLREHACARGWRVMTWREGGK